MTSILEFNQSDFNMRTLISMRYDEERGLIKVYNIRGTLILEENGKRRVLN